jgi:hypothetical protein
MDNRQLRHGARTVQEELAAEELRCDGADNALPELDISA